MLNPTTTIMIITGGNGWLRRFMYRCFRLIIRRSLLSRWLGYSGWVQSTFCDWRLVLATRLLQPGLIFGLETQTILVVCVGHCYMSCPSRIPDSGFNNFRAFLGMIWMKILSEYLRQNLSKVTNRLSTNLNFLWLVTNCKSWTCVSTTSTIIWHLIYFGLI